MPSVEIEIGSRRYQVACRAGEEEHLQAVAAIVDGKARDAAGALGSLGETRQLLIASLLLADQIHEQKNGAGDEAAPLAAPALGDPRESDAVADALERLAERMESLVERLESGAPTP